MPTGLWRERAAPTARDRRYRQGRVDRGHPRPLHDCRDVAGRAQPRSPRDARRGHEPDRRQVRLRRGRRGSPPLQAVPERR